jgi:hypothetical protein
LDKNRLAYRGELSHRQGVVLRAAGASGWDFLTI